MSGTLTHSASEIVRQLLVDASLAADPGGTWPATAYTEAPDPDSAITVIDGGIKKHGRAMSSGRVSSGYLVNVRVRSEEDNKGYVKANAILVYLNENLYQTSVTIGSTTYLVHSASYINGPLSLGRGAGGRGRAVFVLNYSFEIKQTN